MPTINQSVYAAIPRHGDGVTLVELNRFLPYLKESVANAAQRLVQMGLVERVTGRPTRYRRTSDRPCPSDQRGRNPASHHSKPKKRAQTLAV